MKYMNSKQNYSIWFVLVVAVFITCLITANIVAVKLVDVAGLIVPAGIVIFPISYIVGDVLTEVYGYKQARRVIWLGFLCNLIAVIGIIAGQWLPAAGFWDAQAAYERILGFTPRLLLASFLAFLVGEFANSYVLSRLKVQTKGKHLWARTISSTIVGQGLDSLIFILVAFIGTSPTDALLTAIVTQWIVKVVYEALATPLTYVVVNFIKKQEGIDVYDENISFNPLSVSS
jgi:queuosine precursor transporter